MSAALGVAVVAIYLTAFSLLALYSLHRLHLVRLDARHPERAMHAVDPAFEPRVTVQLPIYNERYVVDRLLDAVAALDYPRDRLEIQVLDDSDDDTVERATAAVARLRAHGFDIHHLRRTARGGYKAGALAAGLTAATGEFLLILDADFVPGPDLIRALLPPLRDPAVAMTQARWGHLNAEENRLTAVQARILDAHFLLETDVRARAGLFFNFHGTAGLWRRSAIVDAGGWRSDTLTEDLDLSYRAQMRGWRFVFLPGVVVPAELPATLAAFRAQQARWAEGTIATARTLLPALLRGVWPARIKREAAFHLTTHLVYPATLLVALTALPALIARRELGLPIPPLVDALLAAAVILPVRHFYRAAARRAGVAAPHLREVPYLLLTGVALAASNSRAVLRGALRARTPFMRTPKSAGPARSALLGYRVTAAPLLRAVDAALALYLTFGVAFAASHGAPGAAPFLGALAFAFGAAAVRG